MKLLHLKDIDPSDKEHYGNKGTNLARLYKARFPVPPAYIFPVAPTSGISQHQLWEILDEFKIVSVRSSASVSMPGMMDTQLNIKNSIGILRAFEGVYESAFCERCLAYKEMKGIPKDLGTAVIIQKMVDPIGKKSGSGVLFTAHPITKQGILVGEFLHSETGNNIVGGKITPISIWRLPRRWLYQIIQMGQLIERLFGFPQDIEFVIENGVIWILQSRDMKFSEERKEVMGVEIGNR